MRRWDRLVDSYIEEYRARGVSPATDRVHGGAAGSVGSMAQAASPTGGDRAHRCGADHALHRELLELSGQGDGVRNAEHDARLRRLSGAAGSVDDQPAALDEGTEGHAVQPTTEAHRSRAHGSDVARSGAPRGRVQLASVGDGAGDAVRHGSAPRRAGAAQPRALSIAPKGPCASMVARPDASAVYRCPRWCCGASKRICRFGTTCWNGARCWVNRRCW